MPYLIELPGSVELIGVAAERVPSQIIGTLGVIRTEGVSI